MGPRVRGDDYGMGSQPVEVVLLGVGGDVDIGDACLHPEGADVDAREVASEESCWISLLGFYSRVRQRRA
jgi:hypothetical protein